MIYIQFILMWQIFIRKDLFRQLIIRVWIIKSMLRKTSLFQHMG